MARLIREGHLSPAKDALDGLTLEEFVSYGYRGRSARWRYFDRKASRYCANDASAVSFWHLIDKFLHSGHRLHQFVGTVTHTLNANQQIIARVAVQGRGWKNDLPA